MLQDLTHDQLVKMMIVLQWRINDEQPKADHATIRYYTSMSNSEMINYFGKPTDPIPEDYLKVTENIQTIEEFMRSQPAF